MRMDVKRHVPQVRSALFVPGDRPDRMAKALATAADAVVIDLEDGVAAAVKDAARRTAAAFVAEHRAERTILVRVNAADTTYLLADVTEAVRAGAAGIVLPKVASRDDVVAVDRLLGWLEAEQGRTVGSTLLTPILETAAALHHAEAVTAASPRVAYAGGMAARGGDVERAVGFRWSATGEESLPLRAATLLAVRAAGVPNPLSGVWTDVGDLAGLDAMARQTRALGYEGMFVIHPDHVAAVNAAFSPSPEELDHHRRVIDAMRGADGGTVVVDGEMADAAMLATAEHVLAQTLDLNRRELDA